MKRPGKSIVDALLGNGGERLTDGLRDQLRQVVEIQHEMLRRLLQDEGEVPLELAEAFEDAGNRFLDLSEMISHRWRVSKAQEG